MSAAHRNNPAEGIEYPADCSLEPVAQVLKSYGTLGEVLISFYPSMPEEIDLNEPIFLYFEGLSVPFFIESFNLKGSNKALLKLEDIESLEEAEEIAGQKVYMAFEDSSSYEDEDDDEYTTALSYKGWTLLKDSSDAPAIAVGIISGVSDFNGNICLEIGDDLYPYHSDLVTAADPEKKTLTLRIPEGL